MSEYTDIRDAIAAKVSALIGTTLPQDTVVYAGMSAERFAQESRVLAVNVAFVDMATDDSQLLGDALSQPENWLWEIQVSSMMATAHDWGWEKAWDAIAAIRSALCPAAGWKPEQYSDLVMFGGVSRAGWTAAGAVILSARVKHWRNTG